MVKHMRVNSILQKQKYILKQYKFKDMKKLRPLQTEFLLNDFFKNEEYPGWKNIAVLLIEEGCCLVPIRENIWRGGIGNFIKVESAKGAVDCSMYTFDLEYFLTSQFYKQRRDELFFDLLNKKDEAEAEVNRLEYMIEHIQDLG